MECFRRVIRREYFVDWSATATSASGTKLPNRDIRSSVAITKTVTGFAVSHPSTICPPS